MGGDPRPAEEIAEDPQKILPESKIYNQKWKKMTQKIFQKLSSNFSYVIVLDDDSKNDKI